MSKSFTLSKISFKDIVIAVLVPVSYTHLDVYKRQAFIQELNAITDPVKRD